MYVTTTLIGRLEADPQIKVTKEGETIATFTVITSRRTKEGNKWVDKDVTPWRCYAWGDFADAVNHQFRGGDEVVVYGQLSERVWSDRNQVEHRSFELRCDAAGNNLRYGVPK